MTGATALTGPGWGRLLHGPDAWRWLAIGLFLAAGIGLRSPWPADEPRFALAALDMVNNGHWLLPHRGGEIYADKPPLFMWLQAAAFLLTGNMKVAFLLPSLLASLLTLSLVFDLVRRLAGRDEAWFAVLLLLVTVQFTAQAKSAQIDATLTGFTTLGLYGLLRHLCLGPAPRWHATAWLAMGAGVITKGVGFLPVLALPGLLAVRWLQHKQWQRPLGTPGIGGLLAPLLILLPAALWLLPLLARAETPTVAAYLDNILLRQTATRYVDGLGHFEPFWYYVASVIPGLWLPTSLLLPWLLPDWLRHLRRLSATHWALVSYLLLALLFFSASPGKRGVYLLPLLPAVAVLSGLSLPVLRERLWPVRLLRLLSVLVGLLLVAAAGATVFDAGPLSERVARADLPLIPVTAFLLSCGTVWIAAAIVLRRGGAFSVAIVASWLLLAVPGYLLLDPVRSAEELMASTAMHLSPESELAIVGFREQQLLQADRAIRHWSYHDDIEQQARSAARWLQRAAGRRVLITEVAARTCFRESPGVALGYRHRREWRLVAASDVVDGSCDGDGGGLPLFVAPYAGYPGGRS